MSNDPNLSDAEIHKLLNAKKEIWYLHGANASPTSFRFLRNAIEEDPEFDDIAHVDISYNAQESLTNIVQALAASISKRRPVYLVGHSLGGVIASRIAQWVEQNAMKAEVRGVFTMASPFGGSESADYLQWIYPAYHLFKNISTQNKTITDLQARGAVVPTTSLVTTSGNNPLMPSANDGVVTLKSQRSLRNVEYIQVPFNHFEVLLAEETVDYLKAFLKNNP